MQSRSSSNDISTPNRAAFLRLARTHTLVPVYRTLTADLETPVSAFLRLAADEPECFLLESVEGGEKVGRYTFIGVRPYRKILAHGNQIEVSEQGKISRFEGDVFALLKDALHGHRPARLAGLPPFTAGAVGFFSYDAVRQIERLPSVAKDDLGMPDACLMFFDEVLAFDHVKKEILLIVTADLNRRAPQAAYADALKRLDGIDKRLARPLPKPRRKQTAGKLKLISRTKKKDSRSGEPDEGVHCRGRYIPGGALATIRCRARRRSFFDLPFAADCESLAVYVFPAVRIKASRGRTPEVTHIVGSSPELLVRVHQQLVEYRPIAGTRPRSADEEEDRRIAEELFTDEKERAEHVMLSILAGTMWDV